MPAQQAFEIGAEKKKGGSGVCYGTVKRCRQRTASAPAPSPSGS